MNTLPQRLMLLMLLSATACSLPQGVPMRGLVATPPSRPCPDWSRSSREDFSNRDASNFGCADDVNFRAQLADPRDAVRGRGGATGDGIAAAAAMQRLRSGQSQLVPGGASAAGAGPSAGAGPTGGASQ